MTTPVPIISICIFGFLAAYFLTAAIRRWAPNLKLIQPANSRSSHVNPTPTGGGTSFALVAVFAGAFLSLLEPRLLPLTVFCIALSSVGLADDLFELGARIRLFFQFVCVAALLIFFVKSGQQFLVFTGLQTWVVLAGVSVFCLWWINLVNFMDGIDGLVATQSIAILICGTVLKTFFLDVPISLTDVWVLSTAFAIGGFLMLNFPPAKIFMGDAGSYFIASFLLVIVLEAAIIAPGMILVWVVLSTPLICDATVTILVRLFRGERWFAPHRQHAYQHLSRKLGSHRRATIAYLAQFGLVSIPGAIICAALPQYAYLACVVTFLVLAALAMKNKAGLPEISVD